MRPTAQLERPDARHMSALSILFARYIAGQIAETTWDQFTNSFDEVDASAEERLAFAGYFNDVLNDKRPVPVPPPAELQEILSETRSS